MTKLSAVILAGSLVLLASPAAAQQPFAVQAEAGSIDAPRGDLFIRNLDSVWTATGEVLENVSISIRDGVIREIGRDISPSRNVTVIDGTGLTAMPGIVDEHSHTAIDRGGNEGTAPIVPEVSVLDALNPEDFSIYRALSGGVTTALILHGSSNPIGGQGAIIKMRWGMERPEQLLVEEAPRVVKFALGENVTRKAAQGGFGRGRTRRYPESRAGVEALYVQAFTAAQEYKRAWDQYDADPRGQRMPPRRDLRLEALVDIMEGQLRVHAHSYRSDEIVMLMRVAERFGFRIDTFTHVLEGYKVADELAEHGAGASTFADWWAYKLEAYDAIPYNAAIMQRHGVLTSLNSDLPYLQTTLVYEMMKPVKYGAVSKEEALRMLTINPARQLHIEDQVGTIEVGKQADIVLLNGDPFDTYSRIEKTIVDGIVYYDLNAEDETRGEPFRSVPVVDPIPDQISGGYDPEPERWYVLPVGLDLGAVTRQGATMALIGATVHPVSTASISDGVVVVSDGRIAAVGSRTSVDIPAGTQVIRLDGKHVYPGMIDPLTQVGMIEIGQVAASRDDREVGRYNPHMRALSGVHPHSAEIEVTRANGITTVMSAPTSGVVRGMGSVIQLDGDTPERMAIASRAALVVDFPTPAGQEWDDPELRGERLEELVELFERSVQFAAGEISSDDPTAPFEANVWGRDDVLLGAMAPAITGQVPTFFTARTERQIRTLLLFLDEFPDVRPVVVGGDQAFRVAGELAQRRIPVVVGSTLIPTLSRSDAVSAGWENAAVLYAAGVKVAFSTSMTRGEEGPNVRNLPYHAARAVAFGLPKDAALQTVTLNAAEILGLGDEAGSIEVGKRADLIVTDGDPLQIVTNVERVFIGGNEVSVESRHTRLWESFRSRR
jgi:imidazolonepropionase-like amidohydrolase